MTNVCHSLWDAEHCIRLALGDVDGDCDLDVWMVNEDEPNLLWLNGELPEIRTIRYKAGKVVIDYIGSLESCHVVDGDYELVEDLYFSPYTFTTEGKARFFRAR